MDLRRVRNMSGFWPPSMNSQCGAKRLLGGRPPSWGDPCIGPCAVEAVGSEL